MISQGWYRGQIITIIIVNNKKMSSRAINYGKIEATEGSILETDSKSLESQLLIE
jgi:hypothetical protein